MTLSQIACMAGVSPATVSAALRDKPGVRATTKERVRRIARDLGYEPHAAASALAGGKARLIGIAPFTPGDRFSITPWAAAIIGGLNERIAACGMEVVLVREEGHVGLPRLLAQRAIAGLVMASFPHPRLVEWLGANAVPCVGIDVGKARDMDSVRPDSAGGVRQAIEHLAELGHRRIAYINTPLPPAQYHAPTADIRLHGFLKTMAELSLAALPGSEIHCDVRERVAAVVAHDDPPTGLVCYSDQVAMGAIQILTERRLRVGADVSVVGIDDIGDTQLANPPLTSVHVPFIEMGRRGGELLLSRIAEPERPIESVELPEKLIIRKSTGPAPRG